MNGYFKPLRRKIGVMTLVMACVFTAGWVRSLIAHDVVSMHVGEHEVVGVLTGSGRFALAIEYLSGSVTPWEPPSWQVAPAPPVSEDILNLKEGITNWRVDWYGFGVGGISPGKSTDEAVILRVPFLPLVFPLTAISAWLLLSKPRPKIEPPTTSASGKP